MFSFCESSLQTQTYHRTEEQIKVIYENTGNKKEYRRLLTILQKGEGRTFEDIANEHGVSSRSVEMGYCLYPKWD